MVNDHIDPCIHLSLYAPLKIKFNLILYSGHFLAPGDEDGSVVMGVVVIIQDVLALLPDAEVL